MIESVEIEAASNDMVFFKSDEGMLLDVVVMGCVSLTERNSMPMVVPSRVLR